MDGPRELDRERLPRLESNPTHHPEAARIAALARDPRSTMTHDDRERLKELFGEAADLPPRDRGAFVERVAADDATLRSELLSLLEHLDDSRDFLASPLGDVTAREAAAGERRRFGAYEVVAELPGDEGRFLATRVGDPRGSVVMLQTGPHAGAASGSTHALGGLRARLTSLHHPFLARVRDVGVDDGIAYVVEEHVQGVPLENRLDRLSRPQRMALFARLCDAVEHVHAALVPHGGLSTRTVCVSDDGSLAVRGLGTASVFRAPGELGAVVTPYASPEAVRGDPLTVASDVYSLGAILYELVVGRPPFPTDLPSAELERLILEEDPHAGPRPSRSTAAALRAMDKDPARRFTSVRALSEALGGGRGWLPRRAWIVTAASVAVIGVAWSQVRVGDAVMERDRARGASAAVLGALGGSVAVAQDADAVRVWLDEAATRASRRMERRPFEGAEALLAVGQLQAGAGLFQAARVNLEAVLATLRERLPEERELTARVLFELGTVALSVEDGDGALRYLGEAVAMPPYDRPSPLRAGALTALARARLLGEDGSSAADSLLAEASGIWRRVEDPMASGHAETLFHHGTLKARLGETEPALRLHQRALDLRRSSADVPVADVLRSLHTLAELQRREGRLEEARPLFEDFLAVTEARHGSASREGLDAAHETARFLHELGDSVGAETLYRRVLRLAGGVPGDSIRLAAVRADLEALQGARPPTEGSR